MHLAAKFCNGYIMFSHACHLRKDLFKNEIVLIFVNICTPSENAYCSVNKSAEDISLSFFSKKTKKRK